MWSTYTTGLVMHYLPYMRTFNCISSYILVSFQYKVNLKKISWSVFILLISIGSFFHCVFHGDRKVNVSYLFIWSEPLELARWLTNVKCCAVKSVCEEEGKTTADSVTYVCVMHNFLSLFYHHHVSWTLMNWYEKKNMKTDSCFMIMQVYRSVSAASYIDGYYLINILYVAYE